MLLTSGELTILPRMYRLRWRETTGEVAQSIKKEAKRKLGSLMRSSFSGFGAFGDFNGGGGNGGGGGGGGGIEFRDDHGDNGIFAAEEFRNDYEEKRQSQSFSGVGAQHQNARAERAIQTIMYMAQTFMVHASLHWTERGSDDLSLWSFTVKHSVWIYNRVPNVRSGLTPLELTTRERSDYKDILRSHVWGCPVFVPVLVNDPNLLPISEDGSVDSSLYILTSDNLIVVVDR